MKKNENIFISLQIQKDLESKKLMLSVQFDKNAPNISTENETLVWYPTCDEMDFISEVFELIGSVRFPETAIEKPQNTTTLSEEITMDSSQHSSEIKISPLEDDVTMDVSADLKKSHIKNKENNEKIFYQADEKKIDEILNRKKPIAKEDCVIESGQKIRIDQMLRQKKKK